MLLYPDVDAIKIPTYFIHFGAIFVCRSFFIFLPFFFCARSVYFFLGSHCSAINAINTQLFYNG